MDRTGHWKVWVQQNKWPFGSLYCPHCLVASLCYCCCLVATAAALLICAASVETFIAFTASQDTLIVSHPCSPAFLVTLCILCHLPASCHLQHKINHPVAPSSQLVLNIQLQDTCDTYKTCYIIGLVDQVVQCLCKALCPPRNIFLCHWLLCTQRPSPDHTSFWLPNLLPFTLSVPHRQLSIARELLNIIPLKNVANKVLWQSHTSSSIHMHPLAMPSPPFIQTQVP